MGGGYLLIILILLVVTNGITYGASQLTSESVSYTKDGKLTTVKSALDDLINTSLIKIDKLEKQVADYKSLTIYLADNVKVGDYVAYNAGTWDSSKGNPTQQDEFGGYTVSTSKNSSVACYESTAPKLKGWRVLKNDGRQVTLVHAGQPECYYNMGGSSSSETKLNERAQSTYVDNKYAESAHALNYDEAKVITDDEESTDKDLRKTGAAYWLANAYDSSHFYSVRADGGIGHTNGGNARGFRPVVELKANIKTIGKGTDMFGQEAWILA